MKILVWKLGSLEHRLYPSKEAIEKLRSILENASEMNTEDTLNIVWGPDISVQEINIDEKTMFVL